MRNAFHKMCLPVCVEFIPNLGWMNRIMPLRYKRGRTDHGNDFSNTLWFILLRITFCPRHHIINLRDQTSVPQKLIIRSIVYPDSSQETLTRIQAGAKSVDRNIGQAGKTPSSVWRWRCHTSLKPCNWLNLHIQNFPYWTLTHKKQSFPAAYAGNHKSCNNISNYNSDENIHRVCW